MHATTSKLTWARACQAVLVLAVTVVLAACASSSASSGAPASGAVDVPATVPAPAAKAECTDASNDAKSGDITQVELQRDGEQLSATFHLRRALPGAGTASTVVTVSNAAGDKIRLLGVQWLEGQLIGHFVFDFQGAMQTNLEDQPTVDGKTISARYPWSAVADLGDSWKWQAVTTLNGNDVDSCPNIGRDSMNPKKARFPSS